MDSSNNHKLAFCKPYVQERVAMQLEVLSYFEMLKPILQLQDECENILRKAIVEDIP